MIGTRLSNNCYHWNNNAKNLKCNLSKSDETMLWHKWLGNLSVAKTCKTVKVEAIHGVPFIKNINNLCSQCPAGKQTKHSHKSGDHNRSMKSFRTPQQINEVLELLHLNLMGPMQVESLGGKRYVFVIIEDYFRFT